LRKVWAPIGSRPNGIFWWSNKKANSFGALIDGKKLFYDWFDRLNAHSFINFMKKLIDFLPKDKKYVFILDNGPCHKAKITKKYFASLGENYKIEFLPPYSPQLNAIETCWKIIRHNVTNSNIFPSIDGLKAGIEQFLNGYFFTLNSSNYLVR
jgi:transposase